MLSRLRLGAQFVPPFPHLLARLVERAAVVDYIVGGFDFFFVRELCRHAAGNFFSGLFHIDLLARGATRYPLLVAPRDYDQAVETVRPVRLADPRRLHDGYALCGLL